MTPNEIVVAALAEGVVVTLSNEGNIKVRGEQVTVDKWRSILVEHKDEIVRHLTAGTDPAPTLPAWCKMDCQALEVIEGVGPGCVKTLPDGPWSSEWRRMDSISACPKKMN